VSGEGLQDDYGANSWLVDEMYQKYRQNPDSVDKEWWPILENYKPSEASPATPLPSTPATPPQVSDATSSIPVIAKTTAVEAKPQPIPAQAPVTESISVIAGDSSDLEQDVVSPLKGMAKTIAANMDLSLQVPTATSVRTLPAKLMIDNRLVINSHLSRTRGGKISFTHIIGFAIIQALKKFPSQNVYYDIVDEKPVVVQPANVNFGLAIDIPKPDGSRALLVPNIKRAQRLNFAEFLAAYEDLVTRARLNTLTAGDFQGTTISLTNPGGIGTVHSVPRLTKNQGCIVGAGALDYPAE
jgi:2-oxoglutarate dehydrogenase E1 component